jgi:hypothetical protein
MRATPLIEIPQNQLNGTLKSLSSVGATTQHAAWLRKPRNAALVVAFMDAALENAAHGDGSSNITGIRPSDPIFVVRVVYIQPGIRELERRFHVCPHDFEGTFVPIERCKDVNRKTRKVEFRIVRINRRVTIEVALAILEMNGLRPALYEEFLAFACRYPKDQLKHGVVALGSVKSNGPRMGHLITAVFDSDGGFNSRKGRHIYARHICHGCDEETGLLAVRKDA